MGDPWRKPSPELVDSFLEAVAGTEGLDEHKMFGFPAAFVGGNMAAGLHQETMIVRVDPGRWATPRRAPARARRGPAPDGSDRGRRSG